METAKRTTLSRGATTVHVASVVQALSFWRIDLVIALLTAFAHQRIRLRSICSGMVFLTSMMLCTDSLAEASKFSKGELGYYPYSLLVEEKPGHHFVHGADLTLTMQSTEKAKAFFRKPFLIRIFRVQGKGQAPLGVFNYLPCYVFLSVPYQFSSGVRGEQIVVGQMASLGWLAPMFGGSLGTGKFLLVFEPLKENDEVIRLHENDRADYFAAGLYIEVDKAPTREYRQADVDAAARQTSAMVELITPKARANDSKYRCYDGKRLADDGTSLNWKFLASCDDEGRTPDDFSG